MHYIYKITTGEDRIYYGYTSRNPKKRLEEHLKSAKDGKTKFHYSLSNHGLKSFEVLHEYKYELPALKKEIELIYKNYGYNSLNTSPGGEGSEYIIKVLEVKDNKFTVSVEKRKNRKSNKEIKFSRKRRTSSSRRRQNRRR